MPNEPEIEFWKSMGGSSDVFDFFKSLTPEDKAIFFRMMRAAHNNFNASLLSKEIKQIVKSPRVYQLKFRAVRLLFHIKDKVCWFLVGFFKKEQKTRNQYIEKATKRTQSLYN